MKQCTRCKQLLDTFEFGKHIRRPDGLQDQCRACKKQFQHDWYIRNRERHVVNVQKRQQARIAAAVGNIVAYLRDHPCVDCGESNPVVLEFDHVRGTKSDAVMSMVHKDLSWERIAAEIAKCEVRCANCHRIRTSKSRGYLRSILMGLTESEA